MRREGADWAEDEARELGALCGLPQTIRWGVEANQNPPKLRTHDRFGNRIDEVEFHPAWHELMRIGIGHGLHALPWRQPQPGAHVARGALFMLLGQVEAGVGCPISMTYSVIPALRTQPELAAEWEPRFLSLSYDGERLVPAPDKKGALCGMGMTEKQGGSDVRANITTARPLNGGGPGGEYEITGHKWFFSAPMCDAFLVLAQADGGLSCFLLPRFTPDGERNRIHLQRLKDKLGNRSNASSEVEFRGAWAQLVGEEGRGVPTIIEMVNHTRLDCVLGVAAGSALGHRGGDPPLHLSGGVRQAARGAAADAKRARRPGDRVGGGDGRRDADGARVRSRRTPADEAASRSSGGSRPRCSSTGPASAPRSTRSRPWSAWAATGTSRSRACRGSTGRARSPRSGRGRGTSNASTSCARCRGTRRRSRPSSPRSRRQAARSRRRRRPRSPRCATSCSDLEGIECRARAVVERMALALQASLLVRYGDPAVADAFCASRLEGDSGLAFGTLPAGTDFGRIIERHSPHA